jgi:hypothetical protein
VKHLGNVILFAVLGTGSLLALATIAGVFYRLCKVRFTLVEGLFGLGFVFVLCAMCLTLFGIGLGFRHIIYEGCLIRRATPEFANFLVASIFAPYGMIAVGAYLLHLNSNAYSHAKEKIGKNLGLSIRDTLDYYRGEPLTLITQATVFACIHIFFNALIVSAILLQPLQGLAFGTTNYDKFHLTTYADGCVPYNSDHWRR